MRLLSCTIAVAVVLGAAVSSPAAPPKPIGTLTIEALGTGPSPIFSFSLTGSNPPASGGAGTGKATFSTLALAKPVDGLSPKLLHQLANGETVPQAQIDLQSAKGVRPVALTIIVYDVHIAGDALSDGGENVELAFDKIRETAHTPDGDVTTCWDIAQNLGC